MSSTELVKSSISSGRSLKPMTKNSSWGLAVLMNCRIDSAGADQLRAHGAGEVEDDADRDRRIFAGEGADLLLAVVLEDLEVLLFEAGDQPVHGIGDRDRNQHHVHVHADAGAGMELQGAGAGCGRRLGSGGRSRGRRGGRRRRHVRLVRADCPGPGARASSSAAAKAHIHSRLPSRCRLAAPAGGLALKEKHLHASTPTIEGDISTIGACWRHRPVIALSPFNPRDGQRKSRSRYRHWDTIEPKRATAPNRAG